MKTQQAEVIFQRGDLNRKVSVVVPLHNYARFIEQTLDSVAQQTFRDLALIVVDDASTDDSRAVAEQWMRDLDLPHLSVLLLANTSNAKLSITRNTGIDRTRSEYCFFLDADNLLLPRCLEKHVRALQSRRDCAGAYSIIAEFGGGSGLVGGNVFSRERLKSGNYIDAMVMFRRTALIALGGFEPIKHGWEDYELWLRMCEQQEQLVHIPEVLSRYRHHQNSMLRQQTNVGQNIIELHATIEGLHPWVRLAAPHRYTPPVNPETSGRSRAEVRAEATASIKPVWRVASPVPESDPYKKYERQIFTKLEAIADRKQHTTQLDIDTDFTGPADGTPFDSFVSDRHREVTAKQVRRMLELGVVAINPRPGVHAARQANGDFLRYRSIAASGEPISRLPQNVLIHIHAFYPDVVEEMLEYFIGDARQGRFLITTTTRKNSEAVRRILVERGFDRAKTVLIENKGRDIGPFLDHAIAQATAGDVICHIHTKKSPDVGGVHGEKLRELLYGSLLTQDAVDAFAEESLGLLFPDDSRPIGWGKNRPLCQAIAEKFSRELGSHPGPVPIGNMFFARHEVAQAMRAATLGTEWPREPVPYDGTVLHAIERMWPTACEFAGLTWAAIHRAPRGATAA